MLSVLVPFYRDNPLGTLTAIAAQCGPEVEVLAWDDGTGSPELTAELARAVPALPADVRIWTGAANAGRSAARNALFARARGAWVLFLDADMRPGDAMFVARYLDAIGTGAADVLFGGFRVEASGSAETRLHRALSQRSDCLDAAERAALGAKLVASSNLAVRADVLRAEPFDDGFTGWGWEDSEWAARVAARYRLEHLDNPAVHLGLETDSSLLSRFASSGGNYRRFVERHPDLARDLPLYRHALTLGSVPGQAVMRPVLKAMVRLRLLPVGVRVLALKLWRASHYADALKPAGAASEVVA